MRRRDAKANAHARILEVAGARLRDDGVDGASIAEVMTAAGLTHGAFYAHFANKQDLLVAAFQAALTSGRRLWFRTSRKETWSERIERLARRYLNPAHRDDRATSCGFSALASEIPRSERPLRRAYEAELLQTLARLAEPCEPPVPDRAARQEDAIAFLALCIGGLSMARGVTDPALSDAILKACRKAAARLASGPAPAPSGASR
ncbi:TetR/AcrR family transcriptional regulator [Chelatococcus reniformis]|uniref:TetR family transcriptional regulator n=1 Tax=Chelatococcus reniformis TaxID=1494448 RepID=A0A916XBW9_9HYPH|nr:TetR/AcrR family transcriptional regulator [Chelatococcus reniformis]GGC59275.1 TetR family transcriptional regulator [Chelatococcus reniformis]